MAASKGVYGESAGEWTPADALGYSKMLALTGVFYKRAGAGAELIMNSMRTDGRRQDRLGDAGLRPVARDSHRREYSLRGRAGGGGRDPEQQVELQHAWN